MKYTPGTGFLYSSRIITDSVQETQFLAIYIYMEYAVIQSVGASVLYQSPYSPDFNPIEHWWSQLKAFLRLFSPTTLKMVDVLIATALDLMNPKHF